MWQIYIKRADRITLCFQDAFEFCFEQVKDKTIITPEFIFKNVMRCVSRRLDYLWKHNCE